MMSARGHGAMNPSIRQPAIDAAHGDLRYRRGLGSGQQRIAIAAHGTGWLCSPSHDSFVLKRDDFDSSRHGLRARMPLKVSKLGR